MNDIQVSGEDAAATYREFESGRVCLSILLKVVVFIFDFIVRYIQ